VPVRQQGIWHGGRNASRPAEGKVTLLAGEERLVRRRRHTRRCSAAPRADAVHLPDLSAGAPSVVDARQHGRSAGSELVESDVDPPTGRLRAGAVEHGRLAPRAHAAPRRRPVGAGTRNRGCATPRFMGGRVELRARGATCGRRPFAASDFRAARLCDDVPQSWRRPGCSYPRVCARARTFLRGDADARPRQRHGRAVRQPHGAVARSRSHPAALGAPQH
jgi:hypothetical protein